MTHPGLVHLGMLCLSELLYGSAEGGMLGDPHLTKIALFLDISRNSPRSMALLLDLSQ